MKDKILVVDFWHTGRESDRMVRLEDYLKLSAENAKLRECVEFYADLDEEAIGYDIRGVTYARQVLKELDKE